MPLPLFLSALVAVASSAAPPRETVNFDYAWRFQAAVEPRYEMCTFEQNMNYGVGQIWAQFGTLVILPHITHASIWPTVLMGCLRHRCQ